MGTAPRGEFDPAQGVHRDDELEFILRMLPSRSFAQCGPTGRSWPALSLGSGRRQPSRGQFSPLPLQTTPAGEVHR